MHIRHLSLDQIREYPDNAKAHPAGQVHKIAAAITEFRWDQPIVVDADLVIIKGHGRFLAAREMGLQTVPVVVADYLTPAQVRAARLADNKVAESEWFPEALARELKALQELDFNLELTGFDLSELEALHLEGGGDKELPPEDPGPEPDRAAELQQKWGTALGQIWQAGRHRLMCGNALTDLDKLLAGEKIDLVFTDPPYGANIVKKSGASIGGAKPFGQKRGWVGGGAAYQIPFGGRKGSVGGGKIAKVGKYAPIIGDDTTETAIRAARLCLSREIPVLIFWGGNYYAEALPPSRCWLVWDKENTGNFADVELAWTNLDKPARLFRHMWNGLMKASERGEARVHPTQKPVALAEWALQKFGKDGDAVLDLFVGSGFTLVACERLGRRGFGMELSPEYVAVTLERLARLGLEPELGVDDQMNEEQSLNIDKILALGPMAAAKAYQDILKKIKAGEILSPAEVKSFDLLEKKLQDRSREGEDGSIVDSMDKVRRHFGKSLRQVQRWAVKGMPVLPGGRYDLLQIEAWRRRKQGGRGPAAGRDPRRQGQPELVAEGDKDYWDMRGKKAQAQKRELDLRQRRGELVARREVEQLFSARIMAVKQGLLNLSRGLPPQLRQCQDEREMEGIIARAVRDLLESFSRPLPENLGGKEPGGAEVAESGGSSSP